MPNQFRKGVVVIGELQQVFGHTTLRFSPVRRRDVLLPYITSQRFKRSWRRGPFFDVWGTEPWLWGLHPIQSAGRTLRWNILRILDTIFRRDA